MTLDHFFQELDTSYQHEARKDQSDVHWVSFMDKLNACTQKAHDLHAFVVQAMTYSFPTKREGTPSLKDQANHVVNALLCLVVSCLQDATHSKWDAFTGLVATTLRDQTRNILDNHKARVFLTVAPGASSILETIL